MDGHFGDDDEDETLDTTEPQDNSTGATIYAEEPETFSSNHTCPKIICSLHKLLQLVGQVCQVDGCGARQEVDYRITGCCITVFGICTSGHQFNWNSSDTLTSQAGGMIYLDNLNFASALVLSGNNYRKFYGFCSFL